MRFFQKFLMAYIWIWMLEGLNYILAKFQINILRNKKVIKLLELSTLWKKEKRKKKEKIANTKELLSQL